MRWKLESVSINNFDVVFSWSVAVAFDRTLVMQLLISENYRQSIFTGFTYFYLCHFTFEGDFFSQCFYLDNILRFDDRWRRQKNRLINVGLGRSCCPDVGWQMSTVRVPLGKWKRTTPTWKTKKTRRRCDDLDNYCKNWHALARDWDYWRNLGRPLSSIGTIY